jgi:hypothetical protein
MMRAIGLHGVPAPPPAPDDDVAQIAQPGSVRGDVYVGITEETLRWIGSGYINVSRALLEESYELEENHRRFQLEFQEHNRRIDAGGD